MRRIALLLRDFVGSEAEKAALLDDLGLGFSLMHKLITNRKKSWTIQQWMQYQSIFQNICDAVLDSLPFLKSQKHGELATLYKTVETDLRGPALEVEANKRRRRLRSGGR